MLPSIETRPAADGGDRTDTIADLPSAPGVYLFRARDGEVLYVGKARRLRHRVRSYFRQPGSLPLRTRSLVLHASQVEAVVVGSERESLLLEASLIRAYRPRYNQRLKDGRGYPLLRIDRHGPTPNAALTGVLRDDGAAYFGPFPEAGRIHEALAVIRRLYLLHPGAFERDHSRVRADLRRMASELLDLLEGRGRAVRERIERAMHAQAAEPPPVRARITVALPCSSCGA